MPAFAELRMSPPKKRGERLSISRGLRRWCVSCHLDQVEDFDMHLNLRHVEIAKELLARLKHRRRAA
jgi:hypothetical protein